MNRKLSLLAFLLALPAFGRANELVLQCRDSAGVATAPLKVDVERRTMSWGGQPYTIVNVTDRYITGEHTNFDVGGEIWVLDRVTGSYNRALAGSFCDQNGKNCWVGTMAYQGQCGKPIL